MTAIFCSFSNGIYDMPHPNGKGKQTVTFEDSERFGPSAYNIRMDRLSEISDTHPWFWRAYESWRTNGKKSKPGKIKGAPAICLFETPALTEQQ